MLITAGYTISELAELDFSEGFAIPRSKHKAILNILESNINRVYAALDFYYPYYRERVRYTDYYPGLSNLNRWVDFCNHLKAILEGEEGRPYPLYYDSTTPLYYEYGSPLYYPIYINEEV